MSFIYLKFHLHALKPWQGRITIRCRGNAVKCEKANAVDKVEERAGFLAGLSAGVGECCGLGSELGIE